MQLQVEGRERNQPWPPSPRGAARSHAERARLYLSGVATPVVTMVRERDGHHLTVEQALPFLEVDSHVYDENLRLGRIEAVDVAMNAGVPHLVVRLAYDEPELVSAEPGTKHDTVPGTLGTEPAGSRRSSHGANREATVPFETEAAPSAHVVRVGTTQVRSTRGDETTLVFRTDCLAEGKPPLATPSRWRRARAWVGILALQLYGLARRVGMALSDRMRSTS